MGKFNDIINSKSTVLVDFSAEWCQPCRMMPPILKEVKNALGENIRILTVDVDKNPAVARKWLIQNVPTIMIFKNGEVKWRQAGVVPAPQLINIVKQYI